MKAFLYFLFVISILLVCNSEVWSQTAGQNYIVTTVPYQAVSDPTTLANSNSNTTIQYFDGMGRLSQTVQVNISNLNGGVNGADLVSGVTYDSYGRDSLKWLPGATATGNNGAYVANYASLASNSNGDNNPYSRTDYEASPLNRVIDQYGPGADWYTNGKKKAITYLTNASDVKLFVASSTVLTCTGTYAPGTLYGVQTTDEDGHTVVEYTDLQGRKVLTRMAGSYDTYYVFDDLNNLRYVLPPLASDALSSNTTGFSESTGSTLDLYGYIYHYDGRKRCIQKKLPGCDWINMVYDLSDRLILSQDGNQRLKNKWTMNKYDLFGRLLYSGIVINTNTLAQMQTSYSGALFIESYQGSSGAVAGYTSNNSTPTPTQLLTVNYYDNYSFLSLLSSPANTQLLDVSQSGYTPTDKTHVQTLLTGTLVYHLDNPALYEATALYYDKYGHVVQTRATNHLAGYDMVYNYVNFTGKPLSTMKTHCINGTTVSTTEVYAYTYDKAQRLLTTTHSLNNATAVTLAANAYDPLGRLYAKSHQNGAATTNYSYNVRNWLTAINDGDFKEQVFYQDDPTTPLYNGNIARSTWTYPIRRTPPPGYVYTYDELNRLTQANYYGECSGVIHGKHKQDEYFTYDKMGNVMSIQRNNKGSFIDDLTFSYSGNQLLKITDAATSPYSSYDLTEYTNSATGVATEFLYDANGNLTADLGKAIVAIRYNVLNLPDTIQFQNGNQIINTYNAGGQKLRTQYYTSLQNVNMPVGTIYGASNTGNATLLFDDYVGDLLYENGTDLTAANHPLSRILTPEGYIDYAGGDYYYYKKDHLGSIREVLSYSGTVVQRTQYYPSGTPFEICLGAGVQPYKFTGKELITMQGLNWQDFGARWLDNVRMQFTSMDPLCEKYYWITPYAYCLDNPEKLVDPDGKDIDVWYPDKNGNPACFKFNGSNGSQAPNNAYVQDFLAAYNYDVGNKGGDNLEKAATNAYLSINVSPAWVGSDKTDYYSLDENTVHWDSHMAEQSIGGLRLSPATALEHDMDHAVAANKDSKGFIDRKNNTNEHGDAEEDRVMGGSEKKTAICNKEIKSNQKRIDHNHGTLYPVDNPTSTKPDYVKRSLIETINYWLSVNPNIQITVK